MGAAGKHLGGFAGWQTAGLNHHKRTMPGLANGMGAAEEHLGGFAGGQTAGLNHHKRTMPGLANGMGAAGKHLGGFAGWQTAGLNHHKRTMPGLANGMGAAGKHLGSLGFNHHKRTMPELANGMGAAGKHLGGFAGWQTAGLNSLKNRWQGHVAVRVVALEACGSVWRVSGRSNGSLELPEKQMAGACSCKSCCLGGLEGFRPVKRQA